MRLPARLAANVAWLFTELPWLDRFSAARDAGFAQVEFPWPDDPAATAAAVREAQIGVALLNVRAGDLPSCARGWPNDPSRIDEWRDALREAIELAAALRCPTLNILAGNAVNDLPLAAASGLTLVSELMNRQENPRYLLVTLDDAEPLLGRLGPLGWRLQLDTHHLALTEGDVPAAIRRAGRRIGHLQVSDAPGRHEPGTGGLDWSAIGAALREASYAGAISCEYRPRGSTKAGLAGLAETAALLSER